MVNQLLKEYQFPAERYDELRNSLNSFLNEVEQKGNSSKQSAVKEYTEASVAHTTNQSQRKKRVAIVRQLLIPFLIAKDIRRGFNEEERRIFWNISPQKNCAICGKEVKWGDYEIDHKKAHSKGGKTELNNLQTLCYDCNIGKSND